MKRPLVLDSPVLVVDALGFTARIRSADVDGLTDLVRALDQQFHRFAAKVPHRAMWVTKTRVRGTPEFATLRLNDMFVLHAGGPVDDPHIRFLLCGSLLFQSLLLAGHIPRGGLAKGPICRSKDLLIGNGFIDAYEASEKRSECSRHICAVQVSPTFLAGMPNTQRAWQLLCFFEGHFYVHPWTLTDPEMGEFSAEKILDLLGGSGANAAKLDATRRFFEGLEDYEAAKSPDSVTRRILEAAGAPWRPAEEGGNDAIDDRGPTSPRPRDRGRG